jgi:hypothetical protein
MSNKRRKSDLKVRKKNLILILGLHKTRKVVGLCLVLLKGSPQAGVYSGNMAGVTFSFDYLHMHQEVRKKRSTQSSSDTGKTTVR